MKKYYSKLFAQSIPSFWYGEGDEGSTGEPPVTPVVTPPAEKTFTQKDVDVIVKQRLARDKTDREALVKQLEGLKTTTQLSEQQQTELQTQIDNLNASLRTKDEQAAFEKKNLEEKHSKLAKTLETERDTWMNRFKDSTMTREITDAAVSADGLEPSQFVMMFMGATRLEEVKGEDGKPTGDFISKIKFQGLDSETKKPVTLDLPVKEAFLKMKELGLHKNLFKHGAAAGTGEPAGGGTSNTSSETEMPKLENYKSQEEWQAAYYKWRDKNPS